MNKLKIGIVGVGNISNVHINAYLKNPNVELYAFCDINESQLKKQGEKYNVSRLYDNMNKMLVELPELDAVSICTWNNSHAEYTISALNAGKHVLCEKPMATSAKEAVMMKEASLKNNRKLMIGFVRRFGNDCEIIKDFIKNNTLGEIYYAKAIYLRRNGNPGGWFSNKTLSGGGPLIDLGVHVIDLVRYLLGNPKAVSVYGATFNKLGNRNNLKDKKGYISVSSKGKDDICDVEDLAVAMIRFENGAVLNVETSFSLNIKNDQNSIELFGTKGGAKLNPELEIYTEINNYLADVRLNMPTALSFEGLFENEINHFVDAILNDKKLLASADDGIEIMKILDAIYKSANTGNEVII
jgi:predicted dehydrogenase